MAQKAKITAHASVVLTEHFNERKEEYNSYIEAIDTALDICRLLELKNTEFVKGNILKDETIDNITKLKITEDDEMKQIDKKADKKDEDYEDYVIFSVIKERDEEMNK